MKVYLLMRWSMRIRVHKSYVRNKRVLQLIKKLKDLEREMRRFHENFFAINLNSFKKV